MSPRPGRQHDLTSEGSVTPGGLGVPPHSFLIASTASRAEGQPTSSWFCDYCAALRTGDAAWQASPRVCAPCGMGLLLQARTDSMPESGDAFMVVDSSLSVQAVSKAAERWLSVREREVVNRPVAEFFLPADTEARGVGGLAALITQAASGDELERCSCAASRHLWCEAASTNRCLRPFACGTARPHPVEHPR